MWVFATLYLKVSVYIYVYICTIIKCTPTLNLQYPKAHICIQLLISGFFAKSCLQRIWVFATLYPEVNVYIYVYMCTAIECTSYVHIICIKCTSYVHITCIECTFIDIHTLIPMHAYVYLMCMLWQCTCIHICICTECTFIDTHTLYILYTSYVYICIHVHCHRIHTYFKPVLS